MRRLAQFELLDELGRGGMGAVYRARDLQLGREVALKLLGAPLDDEDWARFRREAQTQATLRHPNLVGLHSAGTWEGRPYLVMELVEGESLAARLRREGPLDPPEAARIAARIAAALACAHAAGIVHRDVKPENVLLDARGEPRLGDFGLAKAPGRGTAVTATGTLLGTPHYMAPEQARGERDIGPPADLFALGGTLYCMLSGRPPAQGRSLPELLHRIIAEAPPRPSSLRPGLDPRLEAICLRCLAKRPADRFASADALYTALEVWRAGPVPPASAVRSSAPPWAPALAVFLGVFALVTPALWFVARPQDPPVEGTPTPSARRTPRRLPTPPAPEPTPAPPAVLREKATPTPAGDELRLGALLLAGDEAEEARDLTTARRHYEEALRLAPGDPAVRAALGRVVVRLGQREAGMVILEQGLRDHPQSPELLAERGDLRLRTGNPAGARVDLEAALRLGARGSAIHSSLTNLYLLIEEFERALEHADAALAAARVERRPGASLHYARGNVLRGLARWEDALESAERAVALDPEREQFLKLRGILHGELKHWAQAAADLGRVSLGERDLGLLYLRGRARLNSGDAAGTIADARELLRRRPNVAEYFTLLGNGHQQQEAHSHAIAAFEQSLRRKPQPQTHYSLGLSLLRVNRPRAGIAQFERAIALHPGYGAAYAVRGKTYALLGEAAQARADWKRALELLPPGHGLAKVAREGLQATGGE